jgi:hypothetical protein
VTGSFEYLGGFDFDLKINLGYGSGDQAGSFAKKPKGKKLMHV